MRHIIIVGPPGSYTSDLAMQICTATGMIYFRPGKIIGDFDRAMMNVRHELQAMKRAPVNLMQYVFNGISCIDYQMQNELTEEQIDQLNNYVAKMLLDCTVVYCTGDDGSYSENKNNLRMKYDELMESIPHRKHDYNVDTFENSY